MNTCRKITTNELTPGSTVLIRGNIVFSRLASQISGAELQESIKRETQIGMRYPTQVPHTKITIDNVRIIPANPNGLSLEEQYFQNAFYTTRDGDLSYSALNKGKSLPNVYIQRDDKPDSYKQIRLTSELAKGLDVTLIMRVYKTKQNNGITLDTVMVNEPVRFYENNAVSSTLQKMGITLEPLNDVDEENFEEIVNVDIQEQQPQINDPYQNQGTNPYQNQEYVQKQQPAQNQYNTFEQPMQQQQPMQNAYEDVQEQANPQQPQGIVMGNNRNY